MEHSSRSEALHPEHVQRHEVGRVVAEHLAELVAVHEGAAGDVEVGYSPATSSARAVSAVPGMRETESRYPVLPLPVERRSFISADFEIRVR